MPRGEREKVDFGFLFDNTESRESRIGAMQCQVRPLLSAHRRHLVLLAVSFSPRPSPPPAVAPPLLVAPIACRPAPDPV